MLDLASMPAEAREVILSQASEISRLSYLLKLREEEIRLLNFRLWGPKADKLSEGQLALLPLEPLVIAAEVEQEAARPAAEKELGGQLARAKTPRAHHPGRAELPAHLERREEIIPCCPEDCTCAKCGAPRPIIGYESREELDCVPAQFFVKVTKREKRGSCCQAEQGVAVAAAPVQIVPKSKLSNEFVIMLLIAKFQQHQPIYRLAAMLLENYNIDLSRQTLGSVMLRAAELLMAVTRAMKAELLAGNYIQADETTVPCQSPEVRGRNHRAYLWEFSRPGENVVFQFEMGRGRDAPREFLRGFRGILQCDGYAAYDELGPGITYLACMAHLRRGFVEAGKVAPEDPRPPELVGEFNRLYNIERAAKEQNLAPEERRTLRQMQSKPLLAALKARLTAVRQEVTPASKLAKACDYALGQWSRMEVYLENGHVEVDNNWCEGAMRPIALGRKNWLHLGDEKAGPKAAAIISIVETCRRLDIPLQEYLRDVLPKLGDWPVNRVAELTPRAWKAARSPVQPSPN